MQLSPTSRQRCFLGQWVLFLFGCETKASVQEVFGSQQNICQKWEKQSGISLLFLAFIAQGYSKSMQIQNIQSLLIHIFYFSKVLISSLRFFLYKSVFQIPRPVQAETSLFLTKHHNFRPFPSFLAPLPAPSRPFFFFNGALFRLSNYNHISIVSSKPEMLKQKEQWIQIAKSQHKYIVFFQEKVIDITNFIMVHPGGKKVLINYIYKDITDLLFKVYPHEKDSTVGRLNQLVIGHVASRSRPKTTALKNGENSPLREKKKVCFEDRKRADRSQRHKTNVLNASNATTKASSNKNSQNQHTPSKNKAQEQVLLTPQEKKKKRYNVSIKLLDLNTNDEVVEDKYQDWEDKPRTKDKAQAHRSQEDLDEDKPVLKLRCLQVKHMNSLENEHLHGTWQPGSQRT